MDDEATKDKEENSAEFSSFLRGYGKYCTCGCSSGSVMLRHSPISDSFANCGGWGALPSLKVTVSPASHSTLPRFGSELLMRTVPARHTNFTRSGVEASMPTSPSTSAMAVGVRT